MFMDTYMLYWDFAISGTVVMLEVPIGPGLWSGGCGEWSGGHGLPDTTLAQVRQPAHHKLLYKIDQQSTLFLLLRRLIFPLSGKWGDLVDCRKCVVTELFFCF